MAVALICAWQTPVFAHGSEAHMVPMDKTLGLWRGCAVG
jgi:primary-amine oxidase